MSIASAVKAISNFSLQKRCCLELAIQTFEHCKIYRNAYINAIKIYYATFCSLVPSVIASVIKQAMIRKSNNIY